MQGPAYLTSTGGGNSPGGVNGMPGKQRSCIYRRYTESSFCDELLFGNLSLKPRMINLFDADPSVLGDLDRCAISAVTYEG